MSWKSGSKESSLLHGVAGAGASTLGGGHALQGAAGAGAAYNYLKHDQVEQLKAKLVDCNGNSACEADAKQWAADISVANDNELAGLCGAAPGRAICGQALKASMAYDLNGDMHQLTPDDQIRSTHAMLQSVFDTPNGQKYFNDIDSRKDFFNAYANAMYAKGSDVAWPRAAAEVSGDLQKGFHGLTSLATSDSARQWINDTGNTILNYRWNDLKELYESQVPLTGAAASKWDSQVLNKEQSQVQWRYEQLTGWSWFDVHTAAIAVHVFYHFSSPVWTIASPGSRIDKGQDQMRDVRNNSDGKWNN